MVKLEVVRDVIAIIRDILLIIVMLAILGFIFMVSGFLSGYQGAAQSGALAGIPGLSEGTSSTGSTGLNPDSIEQAKLYDADSETIRLVDKVHAQTSSGFTAQNIYAVNDTLNDLELHLQSKNFTEAVSTIKPLRSDLSAENFESAAENWVRFLKMMGLDEKIPA